jgi:hypothetical protein
MARRKMIDGTPATSTEADLEVANKELVPAGPPNSANDKELASKYGDPNKITRGDIITAAIENQKKGMA